VGLLDRPNSPIVPDMYLKDNPFSTSCKLGVLNRWMITVWNEIKTATTLEWSFALTKWCFEDDLFEVEKMAEGMSVVA